MMVLYEKQKNMLIELTLIFTTITFIGIQIHFRHFAAGDILVGCQKENNFTFLIFNWNNIQQAPKWSSYKRKIINLIIETFLIQSNLNLNHCYLCPFCYFYQWKTNLCNWCRHLIWLILLIYLILPLSQHVIESMSEVIQEAYEINMCRLFMDWYCFHKYNAFNKYYVVLFLTFINNKYQCTFYFKIYF